MLLFLPIISTENLWYDLLLLHDIPSYTFNKNLSFYVP